MSYLYVLWKCHKISKNHEETCNSFFLFLLKNFDILWNILWNFARLLIPNILGFMVWEVLFVCFSWVFLLYYSSVAGLEKHTNSSPISQTSLKIQPRLVLLSFAQVSSLKLFCFLPIPQFIQNLHLHLERIS